MQVEFVGCTSAGKSTLVAQMMEATPVEGIDLSFGDDLVLGKLGLRRLKSRWMRAVCVHFAAFCGCVATSWRHRQFVIFAYRALRDAKISRRQQLNQLRKVLKQLGRFEVLRRLGTDGPVVVDEGTLHVAHNLFVHDGGEFNEDLVEQFALQVPLPDVVVYVKSREDILVERTLRRGHARIRNATRQSVAQFVNRAVVTFDALSRHERIAPRTIVIQDGIIVSEPNDCDSPQMKNVMKAFRLAIQPVTQEAKSLEREPAPVIHGGAHQKI